MIRHCLLRLVKADRLCKRWLEIEQIFVSNNTLSVDRDEQFSSKSLIYAVQTRSPAEVVTHPIYPDPSYKAHPTKTI